LESANDNKFFTTDSSLMSAEVICNVSDNVTPFAASNSLSSHHDGNVESPFFFFVPLSLDVVAGDRMVVTVAEPSTKVEGSEESLARAPIHDAFTLQTVAPLGYPFGEDFRQKLLLDRRDEVEPVSAIIQSLDTIFGFPGLLFFLQLLDSVLNNGNEPSFATIRPGDAADRAFCDMSSCVLRYTRFHSYFNSTDQKRECMCV